MQPMLGAGTTKVHLKTILVVDDDETFLRSAKRALSAHWDVLVATNTKEALRQIEAARIQAAVVDCFLGAENGIELIRELKAREPAMMLVLSSGLMSCDIAVAAMRAGAHDVAVKPFSFVDAVRKLEGQEPPTAPARSFPSLARMTWEYTKRVVKECNGNLSMAARTLGIDRNTLKRRLGQLPRGE